MHSPTQLIYLSRAADGRRILNWRNFLRQRPLVKQNHAPLSILNPRFYSFAALRSGVGCFLYFDVLNNGDVPVHSFAESHSSMYLADNGSGIIQPEIPLLRGEVSTSVISVSGRDRLTLSIDFIQFANGEVLFTNTAQKNVSPDGVRAGRKAAINHLRHVLEENGAMEVMRSLPRLHADVTDVMRNIDDGGHGFYCGVTNVEVCLRNAYEKSSLNGVETLLGVK